MHKHIHMPTQFYIFVIQIKTILELAECHYKGSFPSQTALAGWTKTHLNLCQRPFRYFITDA